MTKSNCVNPGEIEQGDLVAYLHGDAATHVADHVARCFFCAEQVEQMRVIDARLLAAFYRTNCPTAPVLADFVLNRLPASEKLRVAVHVRGCKLCAQEVASVRDLADTAPPSLLERLQETLATALLARPLVPANAPVRGEGWQGRFEIDDWIVTLSTQAGCLAGRVRRRGASADSDYSGHAWLLGDEMSVDAENVPCDQIDRAGRFQFAEPAAGSYALLLQIGEQNLAVEGIRME
jgi:hypothetical protein